DRDGRDVEDDPAVVDERAPTDPYVVAVVAPKRRLDERVVAYATEHLTEQLQTRGFIGRGQRIDPLAQLRATLALRRQLLVSRLVLLAAQHALLRFAV